MSDKKRGLVVAFSEGFNARMEDIEKDSTNPRYRNRWIKKSEQWEEWRRGWDEADKQIRDLHGDDDV